MFVSNGYVCASQPTPHLAVESARVVDDLCMLVTFNTGETRLLDAIELLPFDAFSALADRDVFAQFSVEHGVLTWLGGDIDIAPEGLYRRTYEYQTEKIA